MQLIDGKPVYSATDLVGFLACEHLAALERAALAGLVKRPMRQDPALDRIRERGDEHERRYLRCLEEDGRRVTTLKIPQDAWSLDKGDAIRAAAEATRQAILRGDDVIYQACFFDGTWIGYADFLLRVEEPTPILGWRYEVVDTKLARTAKASALLQICSYVEQLERVQGAAPELVRVALGGSKREVRAFRTDDLMAYYRRAKADFEAQAVVPAIFPPPETYPDPVGHCEVCRWAAECAQQRRRDDDLSLVAGIAKRTRRELRDDRDVRTRRAVAALELPLEPELRRTKNDALARVRRQASIQVRGEDQGANLHELLLPPARTEDGTTLDHTKGLVSLPAPRPGDLFLDLEGDPFAFDDGIDYLFGILELRPGGTERFHGFWSREPDGRVTLAGEKRAFEETVDFIMARLREDPDIHVYHYASYERTAFGRLMGRHATREAEVDTIFRTGVLVDLYRVIQQSLIASVESYSIKKLEPFYGYVRSHDLRDANSSIVAFETWLEGGGEGGAAEELLHGIQEYNEDDVRSTWWLRGWLETLRLELAASIGAVIPRPTKEPEPDKPGVLQNEQEQLAARLVASLPMDESTWDDTQRARWLLAQLLGWHRRENKAAWWRYFDLRDHYTDEQRVEEKEPLGDLTLVGPVPGAERTYRYAFPTQEHGVRPGRTALNPDPLIREDLDVVDLDEEARTVDVAFASDTIRHPRSLLPELVVRTPGQERALLDIGAAVADMADISAPGRFQVARDLLLRRPPRTGHEAGDPLVRPGEETVTSARRLAVELDHSYLPIQGPPGSGKTFTGARMILDLVRGGCRVGVVANSHKVIGKLLDSVADAAQEAGHPIRIGQRVGDGHPEPTCARAIPLKDNARAKRALAKDEVEVVGATAWAWSAKDLRDSVDVLVIDEAGQFSLANALAVSVAAKSLVLLGDPQQLDQVIQGSHPPGAERSALAHLLGERKVMDPRIGLFLEHTWRLHPAIADFTSTAFYERQLLPKEGNERQGLRGAGDLDGVGLRWIPVEHRGNETSAPEEAERVATIVARLLDPVAAATWIDRTGQAHPIGPADVLVVTPYNTHRLAIVKALVDRLGPTVGRRIEVGTVDKFQGQEAPISIYAMGSSSGEDAPRGMGFLYSLNRLNVATSRARCLTVVVASPELVRIACSTPEQIRLANALCRFVEAAEVAAPR